MSRALVTGASGMLGSYMVERFLRAGWRVRALCRRPEAAGRLAGLGVEVVGGDLLDPASLSCAVQGCDAVLHAAAVIGTAGDAVRYRMGNVVGTSNVLRAAEGSGARVLHVSSTAVFGAARYRPEATDESAPLPELPPWDAYGRSKQEAEALVVRAHQRGRVWATVVRPPVMYGLRDRQFVPRVGPVMEHGIFPLVGGGRTTLPMVHADSVAEGAVRAVCRDDSGGRVYHLTDDFEVTAEDLVRGAERGLGRSIRSPTLPGSTARVGFGVLAIALRVARRSDLARHARGTYLMLSRDNPFSSRRAREELGWSPEIHPSDGLPEAFRWWREHRGGPGGSA